MEVLKNVENSNDNYQYHCSLCSNRFKSFGKMQEHMLKDHLPKVENATTSLPSRPFT